WEAGEQSGAIRRGVGGAKGGDQGECEPAKHVPDAEPDKRVTGAGAHTASICRHTPKVGAVCGKAARTVLCGGRAMKRASLPLQRRQFITLIGGAAASWPLAARAQQPAMLVVGFLRSTPAAGFAFIVDASRQGLNDAGFVEGKNVGIEYHWADNQQDRLQGLATDLVRRQVAAIVGAGTDAAQASKAATATTPIIFVIGADPVRVGLVASLNRPGGNITGVVFTVVPLAAKLLGMLHELVPKASMIAVLRDPNGPDVESESRDLEEAARAIGHQ